MLCNTQYEYALAQSAATAAVRHCLGLAEQQHQVDAVALEAGLGHQQGEEVELLAGQLDVTSVQCGLTSGDVDGDRAEGVGAAGGGRCAYFWRGRAGRPAATGFARVAGRKRRAS